MGRLLPLKRRHYIVIILIMMVIGGGVYYSYMQHYQMAVLVTPEHENDFEWPTKRKWFDASKWLKTSQYIKIDDFYLLNIHYVPIDDINGFGVTLTLQDAIKYSVEFMPQLSNLNRMEAQEFHQYMKGKLSYEYLRSEFNKETLQPSEDYFLIYFPYKNRQYEVELLRRVYNGFFLFLTNGSTVDKTGAWHSSLNGYSYKDYLAGKAIKEK